MIAWASVASIADRTALVEFAALIGGQRTAPSSPRPNRRLSPWSVRPNRVGSHVIAALRLRGPRRAGPRDRRRRGRAGRYDDHDRPRGPGAQPRALARGWFGRGRGRSCGHTRHMTTRTSRLRPVAGCGAGMGRRGAGGGARRAGLAAAAEPSGYDPVQQTFSALAKGGAPGRWVMVGTLLALGSVTCWARRRCPACDPGDASCSAPAARRWRWPRCWPSRRRATRPGTHGRGGAGWAAVTRSSRSARRSRS